MDDREPDERDGEMNPEDAARQHATGPATSPPSPSPARNPSPATTGSCGPSAAVEGFAAADALAALRACVRGTPLILIAATAASAEHGQETRIRVRAGISEVTCMAVLNSVLLRGARRQRAGG